MKKLLLLGMLVLFVAACSEKPVQKKDDIFSFKEYIFNTTSGTISKKSKISIFLTKDVTVFPIGTELNANLLQITPRIEGKLVLKELKTLVFIPDEDLKSGVEYATVFHLGKLFPEVAKEHKEFRFGFKTIQQNFTIDTHDLQSYSKTYQYIKGEIKSADHLTLSEAKKLIKVTQEGKELPIKWFGDDVQSSLFFDFEIDSIRRLKNDSNIKLDWEGAAIGVKDNSGSILIDIPGESNFSVVNVYVKQFPEQHLRINFSDPLKKQQNLKGLVSIQNAKKLRYVVDGNVLKVFPEKRITGSVNVDVFAGIKNKNNYKLRNPFSEKLTFQQLKPSVQVLTNGVILPDSKNLVFNFKAVNLKAVDVKVIKIFSNNVLQFLQEGSLYNHNKYDIRAVGRTVARKTMPLVQNDLENDGKWKNYAIDISALIQTEPGALYRIELDYKKAYSLFNCEGDNEVIDYTIDVGDAINKERQEETENAYWDSFSGHRDDYYYEDDYYYDYSWRDRENPCTNSYFRYNTKVGGNVLATNIGVIVKNGANNSYFFAITDLLTTNPIPNADIKIYNYQQQIIGETETDTEGTSIIDADTKAAFAIISKGKNKTYVKLNPENSLSLSKFNVAGKRIQKGLKGFIYGERGVWRPGDTIHTVFVLNDASNPLPQKHPVKIQITDPHGKLQFQKISFSGNNGFYRFDVPTSQEDATGNWRAKVSVGGATFSKVLKVETVKPNRLKINIDFAEEILTTQKPIAGTLDVKWLHGAVAKNLKTEVKMKLTSSSRGFDKFPGYNFKDPVKKFDTEELTVFDQKIDANGVGLIQKKVNLKKNAPGLLKATFLTRVFENGGDFSSDVSSKYIAPFKSFVGMKSPKSKRYGSSYVTDENTSFGIATVDDKGNPIQRKNLEVKVYRIRWSWWWRSSSDNLASYVNGRYNSLFKSFKISTNTDGTGAFNVNIPDDESGRYLIRITDPVSGHSTGRTAYFFRDWWSQASGKNAETSTMLVFSSDKEKYNVGEVATLTFPSSSVSNALVSVENSTEVLETQWVKTQKGQTTVKVPVTKEMTPNVFVNISLLQPHASTTNDLPLRLYGVIPILVEDPKTKIEPQISMPEELRPEETFEIKVSEKSGKKMTYTVSVVEEGLLDLTRFKTPDLWSQFYTREALGVRTWDVFNDVIGAFGGTINQVFAIGGGGDEKSKKANKANRFKPVVKVLGPFTLEAGKTAAHKIKLPNYIGSVRTMVVAGNQKEEAYGKAEKATPVRKPLMVLASLPRKLSPSEKVTLPVTVFAMKEKIKNVVVSLKLSDGVKISGAKTQQLHFEKPDEKMAYFELDVTDIQGIHTIEVIVQGHGEKASQKVEIDVINPNPVTTKFMDLELKANETLAVDFEAFGEKGTNVSELEVSTVPPMNFTKRLAYLIQYPHGCVEQTTSSVFPQLYLTSIFDMDFSKKQEIKSNIENGIKRLKRFQKGNGGLSYWIGGSSANDWGTSYAGHFMIEAQKKGFVLPVNFLTSWLKYQKQAARDWRPSSYHYYSYDVTQAYRLYTLALAGYPDLASMNRLREYPRLSQNARWRLAATYALAGHKEVAEELIQALHLDFSNNSNDYYTYGSSDRDRAMALETLLLVKDSRSRELAKILAKRLSDEVWMSTQTTAYCLLSMAKMVELNGGKNLNLHYTMNGRKEIIQTKNTIAQRTLNIKEASTESVLKPKNKFSITNKEDNVVYVRILNSGVLPVGNEIAVQRNFKLFIKYVDDNGNRVPVEKLSQGTDFVALVTILNPNKKRVNDIALTQIFPSGWEIVNTRFTDFGESAKNKVDFTDIRDDRVNFYFSMKKNEVRTFKVLLNASYLGKYYLPGVQAEAMYDNEYFSRTQGKWIEVVK